MGTTPVALLAVIIALWDLWEVYGEASHMGIFPTVYLFFLFLSLQALSAWATIRLLMGRGYPPPIAHILALFLLFLIRIMDVYDYIIEIIERRIYIFLLINFGPGTYTLASALVGTMALAVLATDMVMRTVKHGRGSVLVALTPLMLLALSVLLGHVTEVPDAYLDWYLYAPALIALSSPLYGLITSGVSRPLHPLHATVIRLSSKGNVRRFAGTLTLLVTITIASYYTYSFLGLYWGLNIAMPQRVIALVPLLVGYAASLRNVRVVRSTLIVCTSCGRATLSYLPRCQHCGSDPI